MRGSDTLSRESATELLLTDAQAAAADHASAHDQGTGRRPRISSAALAPVLVIVVAALELRAFLASGLPISFDAHSHLAMSSMVARGISEGVLPAWSNDWYGGFRLLEFYSPAFHMLAGSLGWLIGDVVSATKLVLFLGQILAAVGFYALLRRLTESPWLGVFAACMLLRSVELQVVVGVIGNQPTLFLYAAAPFYMLSALGTGGDSRALTRMAATQALLLAAMLAAHLSNTLMLLPSLLVFAAAASWQHEGSLRRARPRLLAVAAGVLGAFVLTTFETLPMLIDLDAVSLSLVSGIAGGPSIDFQPIRILLGIDGYSYGMPFVRTPGWPWWVLGFAGAAASLHPAARRARPFVAALACSFLMSICLGERAVIGVVLFLLPLSVVPVALLTRQLAQHVWPLAGSVVPLCAALLALILPPTGSLPVAPWAPVDALAPYERLPDTPTRSRTFDVTPSSISLDGFYGAGSYSPMLSGRSIPFGAFPQGAPLGTNVTMSLWSEVVEAFRQPEARLGDDVANMLYLAHVGFLVDRSWGARAARDRRGKKVAPNLARLADEPSIGRCIDDGRYVLRDASPAIFAPRVESLPERYRARPDPPWSLVSSLMETWRADPVGRGSDPALGLLHRTGVRRDGESLLPLVREMGLDRRAARAERFYVEGNLPAAGQRTPVTDRFEVVAHREGLSRVEVVARSSAPGFVRVSQSYDPGLRVELDGEPVDAVADSLGTGIVVAFPQGEHTITILGPSARLRNVLLALSGLIGTGLVVWLMVGRHRATPTTVA